jgi:hypothetical protein
MWWGILDGVESVFALYPQLVILFLFIFVGSLSIYRVSQVLECRLMQIHELSILPFQTREIVSRSLVSVDSIIWITLILSF